MLRTSTLAGCIEVSLPFTASDKAMEHSASLVSTQQHTDQPFVKHKAF
jgi:hypothetical protein